MALDRPIHSDSPKNSDSDGYPFPFGDATDSKDLVAEDAPKAEAHSQTGCADPERGKDGAGVP